MSLDKAIEHGKEHRKPYYKRCKVVDKTCRNHGSCSWCEADRLYSTIRRLEESEDDRKDCD